ncbi:D-cysteine desulfhydrase [Nymphaea thermarum]|nr:D-cysteine desulfhydrase [Nymphaea thermarum]
MVSEPLRSSVIKFPLSLRALPAPPAGATRPSLTAGASARASISSAPCLSLRSSARSSCSTRSSAPAFARSSAPRAPALLLHRWSSALHPTLAASSVLRTSHTKILRRYSLGTAVRFQMRKGALTNVPRGGYRAGLGLPGPFGPTRIQRSNCRPALEDNPGSTPGRPCRCRCRRSSQVPSVVAECKKHVEQPERTKAVEEEQTVPSTMAYLTRILSSRVYDVAIETPLQYATKLSDRSGVHIWLKRQDLQPVRVFSFKLRGACNMMAGLSREQLDRGVICSSAGNHAQGVALAAQRLNCHAVIVMPVTTPEIKWKSVKRLGATVVLFGDSYDEAQAYAKQRCEQEGRTFIHPFDHPDVIVGQGTIGMEIVRQAKGPLHAIFVPVGGGGLIAGIASYIKHVRPEGYAPYGASDFHNTQS